MHSQTKNFLVSLVKVSFTNESNYRIFKKTNFVANGVGVRQTAGWNKWESKQSVFGVKCNRKRT